MGNCLVIQDRRKEVKIMSVDGSKVLPRSLEVHESLPDDSSPPGTDGIFSLLPVKAPLPAVVADPSAVRVKLVVSKQELKKMLDKEGMSLDDMVSLMRKEASYFESDEQESCGGWRPVLESIPEGSDLL